VQFPSSEESSLFASYYLRGPGLGESSTTNFSGREDLFFGAFDALCFRGLEKENVT